MTLSELLATDDYADLTDEQAHELLHRPRHVGTHRVTYQSLADQLDLAVLDRLIESVDRVAGAAGTVDPGMPPYPRVVKEMRLALREQDDSDGLNLGSPKTRAQIDAMAADPSLPLTEGDATAINSLAIVRSDADEHGFRDVEIKHIRWDRTGVRTWR